ncbi:MAG: hypothetical protein GX281_04905 [Bacteroidales bacterium]|jgi:predicted membrane protein|nr:hypothetical protein [Bacteroidales bacterium]NLK80038.1 hypothetical protein [Bacteroidales bacterium]HQB23310.1 hypothetical protein [Bacteroidales bacterium]
MDIKDSAKEYLGLKSDALKLGLVENASRVINRLLSIFLLILVLITALVFLASGATQWLGQVLESTIAASLITGGFFLLLFLVLFLFRKRLFMNTFVRLFINIFFHEKDPNALED